MKRSLTVLLAGLLLLFCTGVSMASTWHFDMQDTSEGSSDTLQTGYTGVDFDTLYTEEYGYGWDEGGGTINRGTYSGEYDEIADLLNDYQRAGVERTFKADVDNGDYYVTLYFWRETYILKTLTIKAEGDEIFYIAQLDAENLLITDPLKVTVTDGTLDLLFTGSTASNGWVINGIDITPVPIPGTLCLLGSGLIGIVGVRRKYKK